MQRLHGVLVRRRQAVLRCEAVIDRNDDGLGGVGKCDAEVVEVSGGGAVEDETAAVVEHYEGKLLGVRGIIIECFAGKVDPRPGVF